MIDGFGAPFEPANTPIALPIFLRAPTWPVCPETASKQPQLGHLHMGKLLGMIWRVRADMNK
jgi:hypothetical protein